MNAAHLHLILNHIPVLGSIVLFFFLAYGMFKKDEKLRRVTLFLVVCVGLVCFATSRSGHKAEDIVEKLPGISESRIEEHEEAGEKALVLCGITSGLALLALLASMKSKSIASILSLLTLLSLLGSSVLLSWTAKLGGEISHPETRSDFREAGQ